MLILVMLFSSLNINELSARPHTENAVWIVYESLTLPSHAILVMRGDTHNMITTNNHLGKTIKCVVAFFCCLWLFICFRFGLIYIDELHELGMFFLIFWVKILKRVFIFVINIKMEDFVCFFMISRQETKQTEKLLTIGHSTAFNH